MDFMGVINWPPLVLLGTNYWVLREVQLTAEKLGDHTDERG